MNKKYIRLLPLICLLLAALIIGAILRAGRNPKTETKRVGYVMTGSTDETGFNGMHYLGIQAACESLGAELLVKEHVEENSGACSEAVQELIDGGAGLIILSSFNYADEVRTLIEANPDISFYANAASYEADNLTVYFARMYQARYQAGIVAATESKTGVIGYVAAMSNSEVNRGISAFALGARSVDSSAQVLVCWTGAWDDEEKERNAVRRLAEQTDADVVTYHQNQAYVLEAAEEAGMYSIGYHTAPEGYSDRVLTAVVCDWELTYENIVKEYLQGNANQSGLYWLGMQEGVVGLSDYSPAVSSQAKERAAEAQQRILDGFNIFSGQMYDNEGNLRCRSGENLSDVNLFDHFDWLAEGVTIYED